MVKTRSALTTNMCVYTGIQKTPPGARTGKNSLCLISRCIISEQAFICSPKLSLDALKNYAKLTTCF